MNEEALVKDFLDLMTVLDQEEAMEIRTINIKYSVNLRGPTESLIYFFLSAGTCWTNSLFIIHL